MQPVKEKFRCMHAYNFQLVACNSNSVEPPSLHLYSRQPHFSNIQYIYSILDTSRIHAEVHLWPRCWNKGVMLHWYMCWYGSNHLHMVYYIDLIPCTVVACIYALPPVAFRGNYWLHNTLRVLANLWYNWDPYRNKIRTLSFTRGLFV